MANTRTIPDMKCFQRVGVAFCKTVKPRPFHSTSVRREMAEFFPSDLQKVPNVFFFKSDIIEIFDILVTRTGISQTVASILSVAWVFQISLKSIQRYINSRINGT